jgi:DNA replication protein DnaC
MKEIISDYLLKFRLKGMQSSFLRQVQDLNYNSLSFEERLLDILKSEEIDRMNKKIASNLKLSRIKDRQARMQDIDYSVNRGLDKSVFLSLSGNYLNNKKNIIITGPTGTGKSFLSQCLALKAIYDGHTSRYYRFTGLFSDIKLSALDSSYGSFLARLSRFNVLVIDDFGINPLTSEEASIFLDILEERTEGGTVITSQLPVKEWYDLLNNATAADAILDRLIYNSYDIKLKGESMRKIKSKKDEIEEDLRSSSMPGKTVAKNNTV